jgi:predicted PurR-regulated permease PerM
MADEHTVQVAIAPRTILWIAAVIAAAWLVFQLTTVMLVITIALVLAGTVDPLVIWLEHHGLRRGRALVAVFFVLVVALAAILVLTIPPLLAQILHLIDDAPHRRDQLVVWLDEHWSSTLARSVAGIPVDNLLARSTQAVVAYSSEVLAIVGYGITALVLAIYLLADPIRARGAVYAVVPRNFHVKLAVILRELKLIVGGYMRGQLITSAAIGAFVFVLLTAFGVDDAFALAVFAALTDVIPFVGGYIASAPVILAVSGSGAGAMVGVTALMFAYQEFESRILVPRVYGRVLRLPPAVVVIALLVGGSLAGILGALLALPIAAGLRMVMRELRVELPGEAPPSATARDRDEQAEHAYEQLAEGVTAQDAAAIASEIAKGLGRAPSHEPKERAVEPVLTEPLIVDSG